MNSTLPPSLAVLAMLRRRIPEHRWDERRVIWCVNDFSDQIDVMEVACRAVDWMTSGQATRLRDREGTLRAFFEKAKLNGAGPGPVPALDPRQRGIYARPRNGRPVTPS